MGIPAFLKSWRFPVRIRGFAPNTPRWLMQIGTATRFRVSAFVGSSPTRGTKTDGGEIGKRPRLKPDEPGNGMPVRVWPVRPNNPSPRFGVPHGLLNRDRVGSNPTGEAKYGDVAQLIEQATHNR